jgi:hypothetical protein
VHLLLPIYLFFEGAMVLLVLFLAVWGFFRWDRRYRGGGGGEGYQPTDEVFKDPTTGRMMRVFFDPRTGRREYREST